MGDVHPFPGARQGPPDLLHGIDVRRLLDVVAFALASVFCPYRYDAPRNALASAQWLASHPLDHPDRDWERAFLARALATLGPDGLKGLQRQAEQIETLKERQRRSERTRRRSAA